MNGGVMSMGHVGGEGGTVDRTVFEMWLGAL